MKAKSIPKKRSSARILISHFLFLQKEQLLLMLVYAVIFLLAFWLLPIMGCKNGTYFVKNELNLFFHMAILMVVAVLPVIYNFKFLTIPEEADCVMCLPQSRRGLFYSRYISGMLSMLVPMALIYVGAAYYYATTSLFIKDNYSEYFLLVLTYAMSFIFFYSLATYIFVHFGRIPEAAVYYVAISVLTALFLYLAVNTIISSLYGVVNDLNYLSNNGASGFRTSGSMTLLNNVWFLIPTAFARVINCIFFVNNIKAQAIVFYIFLALFSVLFAVLANRIFKTRKGDQAQRKSIFKYLNKIFAIVCSLTIGELLTNMILTVIAINRLFIFTIISAIFFYAIYVVIHRTFKLNIKFIMNYLIVVLFYGLVSIIISTGCFGAVYQVPNIDSVESVSLFFPKNNGGYDMMTRTGNINLLRSIGNENQIELSSKDGIKNAADFNKALNSAYLKMPSKDLRLFASNDKNINGADRIKIYIKYQLKNGISVFRYYNCFIGSIKESANTLLSTDEFLDKCVAITDNNIEKSNIKNRVKTSRAYFTKPDSISVSADSEQDDGGDSTGSQLSGVVSPYEFYKAFYEDDLKIKDVYIKPKDVVIMQFRVIPITETSFDSVVGTAITFGRMSGNSPKQLVITPEHKETWAMLDKAGILKKLKTQQSVSFTNAYVVNTKYSGKDIMIQNLAKKLTNADQCFSFLKTGLDDDTFTKLKTYTDKDVKTLYDNAYAIAPDSSKGYRVLFASLPDNNVDVDSFRNGGTYISRFYYIPDDKVPDFVKSDS